MPMNSVFQAHRNLSGSILATHGKAYGIVAFMEQICMENHGILTAYFKLGGKRL